MTLSTSILPSTCAIWVYGLLVWLRKCFRVAINFSYTLNFFKKIGPVTGLENMYDCKNFQNNSTLWIKSWGDLWDWLPSLPMKGLSVGFPLPSCFVSGGLVGAGQRVFSSPAPTVPDFLLAPAWHCPTRFFSAIWLD